MATIIVSIDGVAPRFITPATMPTVVSIGRSGGAMYRSRTVSPSLTLPAHVSMLRGVGPRQHQVLNNNAADEDLGTDARSFLQLCHQAGIRTGYAMSWRPMQVAVGSAAGAAELLFDDGYNPGVDRVVTDASVGLIAGRNPCEVVFTYLVAPDLAGHEYGWGSPGYRSALVAADRHLAQIVRSAGPVDTLIVTTDHGGSDQDHVDETAANLETFIVVRSPAIKPGSTWLSASILDIAPTVADSVGIEPDPAWTGNSLLSEPIPVADNLLRLVADLEQFSYGERVNMAEHARQTAAGAMAAGASDDLVAAALLHDVGHLTGEWTNNATEWGYPDHAEAGAHLLHGLVPPSVSEPIRLHVAAKRWLVANEPGYAEQLSEASEATLRQQGGPFTPTESEQFQTEPFADHAIRLRRWDDDGKHPEPSRNDEPTHRRILRRLTTAPPISGSWLRHACRCSDCRHPDNDQHLGSPDDLVDWHPLSTATAGTDGRIQVTVSNGRHTHLCLIPARDQPQGAGLQQSLAARAPAPTFATAALIPNAQTNDVPGSDVVGLSVGLDDANWEPAVSRVLVSSGAALVTGAGSRSGTVLDVGRRLGFVRTTNYGELFDVRNEPSPENLAYSNVTLGLHTDNPYRRPSPGVQLLHCLTPSSLGGETILVDGFAAARILWETTPEAFNLLATAPVHFRFHNPTSSVDLQARRNIIELGAGGNMVAVNINHRSMEPPEWYPAVDEFYEAYLAFWSILNSEELTQTLSLAAGDVLVFNNRRILHARTGFPVSERRHLQGCYIDMDAVESLARSLATQ